MLLLLLAPLLGLIVGAAARLFVPARFRLTWPSTVIVGVLGAGVGSGLVELAVNEAEFPTLGVAGAFAGAVLITVGGTFAAAAIRERWLPRRADNGLDAVDPVVALRGLIAGGENERVEFKSSARWNHHTGTRDDKIEAVVVRTVAGFLNAEGGTLLIGVDDAGNAIGLADDFSLVKAASADAHELWLRDHLERTLGKANAARVRVRYLDIDGACVCRVDVPPAEKPVFVYPTKGPKTAEFFVRVGNSTRAMAIDEALDYTARRFGTR